MQELVHGFEYAFIVRDLLTEWMDRKVDLEEMIVSKKVVKLEAKDGQTQEKRVQIDGMALRQSYDRGELSRIEWVTGDTNPADSLTKPVLTTKSQLDKIMQTNNLLLKPKGWEISREHKMVGVSTDIEEEDSREGERFARTYIVSGKAECDDDKTGEMELAHSMRNDDDIGDMEDEDGTLVGRNDE